MKQKTKQKTYTIKARRGADARVLEYWLTRYGKKITSITVQGLDEVTPVWILRRLAEELGGTHIKLHGSTERLQ